MIKLITNLFQQKKWLLLALLFAFSLNTEASHFRYGSISWQKINNSTNQVQFKVSTAWRRWTNQQVGQTVSVGTLNFGDGSSQNINLTVLSAQGNSSSGWFYGEAIITHTYPNTTQNYTASFNGCCRIGTLQGGAANGNWNVQTIVNVGTNNNGPVTTVSPIVNVQTGLSAATFNVPVTDPDGDNIRYRLASYSELGNVNNPSGLSVNPGTGQVTMNTIGRAVGSLWVVGIIGEDIDANGNVQSKVLADFMVQIVQQSNPPFFTGPTPTDGTTYQVSPGQNVNFTVQAVDTDPGSTVTLNAIGAPIGTINTSFPITANPVSVAFNWTPTPGNVGTTVVNFTATDNNGVQVSTSVSIIVSMKPQFDIPPTPATTEHIDVEPGQTITYTVQASDPDPLDVVVINEIYGKDMNGNEIPLYANASFSPLPPSPGNPTSGTFSWATQSSDWGHKHVYFYAEDSYGDKTRHEVSQLINTVPVFTSSPAVTTITVGNQYVYNITVSDPDIAYGDQLTIYDITKPAWLTITDSGNGIATLSGIPQLSDVGTHTIEIEAQDINHHQNPGGIPKQSFTLKVNPCNLSLSVSSVQNETCEDASDGAVVIDLQGANDPVSYSWSNGENTQNISNLDAGTYTLDIEDALGCTESVSAIVETVDEIPTVVIVQDLTVPLDASGNVTITPENVDNGSTDACGIASLSLDKSSFDCSNVGTNIVTLTVTDNNNNESTATATVTVEDKVAPTALAKDITVQLDAAGIASITAADVDAGSSDACGIASLSLDKSSFDCSNVGTNIVTLTVTDNNKNESTATATVTVEDKVAPTALAKDITVQLDAAGNAAISAADVDNGSADACGIATLRLDNTSFDCSNIGTNTVILTVTDNNSNISTASAQVTVEDNIAPTVLTKSVVIQLGPSGQAVIATADIDNGSNDACGITSISLSQTSFDCSHVGANTVTLTVTDNNGNTAAASATVTIEDNLLPTVVTSDIVVPLNENGHASITTDDINNGSSDACGISGMNLDQLNFDCSHVGANTVTLTVVDVHGNEASANAVVTITNDLPEITSLSLPHDPVEINEAITASATFADVNLVSASIDWGDGTQSPATISGGAIEATHVYPNSDLYTVILTITDVCGETDKEIFQYVIVTNSNDGHAHGDGYIWSDMGNYLYNPTSEGKAKFKFDVKYKKKKVHYDKKKIDKDDKYVYELDGKAEFSFKEGKLEFKSEEVDWLVVAGQMAVLKGSGKLNKIQGYEFIISAIEGESKKDDHKFRIKIWSTDNGLVVYDNLMGADIDSEQIPFMSKGKIHIHQPKKPKEDKDEKKEKYEDDNSRISANIELNAEILESQIDAYPNPFMEAFSIRHSGNLADRDIELTMRDISGRVVYTKSYNPCFQPEVNIDFDGKKVKQGIYILHLDDGDNSKILKLIKK